MRIIKIAPILAMLIAVSAFALNPNDIEINAELERSNIFVGEQVVYRLTLAGSNIPQGISPQIPGLNAGGLAIVDSTSSRSMRSGSSVMIVINGQVVRDDKNGSEAVTFEYLIQANKPGTYDIGPATVKINGLDYRSKEMTLKVSGSPQPAAAAPELPNENIFIQAVPSRTSVYVGQVISVSYFLYFNNTVNLERKNPPEAPVINGFIQYDFEYPANIRWEDVRLENGRRYTRGFIGRLIVVPTRAGQLEIGPSKLLYQSQNLYTFRRSINSIFSQPIQIDSKEFPAESKPADFSSAVGQFSIDANIDKVEVRAGESVTLDIALTGMGNLQGLADPKLTLPPSVQSFPPEKNEQANVENDDLKSIRDYKYILSPQEEGSISIGPVTFAYFDPIAGTYATATSETFRLNVLKGRNSPSSIAAETEQKSQKLRSDIRYIKPDAQTLRGGNARFYTSAWFVALHLLPLFGIVAGALYRQRRDKLETDTAFARRFKSRDAALKCLDKAKSHIGKSPDDFYRELFAAVAGFISDSFNMPKAGLSPADIAVRLKDAGAPDDISGRAVKFLENCQAARYSPAFGKADETQILKEAQAIVDELRKAIKGNGKK